MKQIIAYVRVSTQRQGASGLGLEAQRDAIARFAGAERCDVVDTFTEVETGKGADALERRPQLAAALKVVHRLTCPIVVSKLDVFDDATVRTIGRTFDAACKELKDTGQPDVVHEVMVKRIIAAARRGERNTTRLRDAALSGLRKPRNEIRG